MKFRDLFAGVANDLDGPTEIDRINEILFEAERCLECGEKVLPSERTEDGQCPACAREAELLCSLFVELDVLEQECDFTLVPFADELTIIE
jgi:hypothetical protein